MGNSSNKYKSSKHVQGQTSSSVDASNTSKTKKKKHDKRNREVVGESSRISVQKKSSFSKIFSKKYSKKSTSNSPSKQMDAIAKEQMDFPKIIISSPSEVEASLEEVNAVKNEEDASPASIHENNIAVQDVKENEAVDASQAVCEYVPSELTENCDGLGNNSEEIVAHSKTDSCVSSNQQQACESVVTAQINDVQNKMTGELDVVNVENEAEFVDGIVKSVLNDLLTSAAEVNDKVLVDDADQTPTEIDVPQQTRNDDTYIEAGENRHTESNSAKEVTENPSSIGEKKIPQDITVRSDVSTENELNASISPIYSSTINTDSLILLTDTVPSNRTNNVAVTGEATVRATSVDEDAAISSEPIPLVHVTTNNEQINLEESPEFTIDVKRQSTSLSSTDSQENSDQITEEKDAKETAEQWQIVEAGTETASHNGHQHSSSKSPSLDRSRLSYKQLAAAPSPLMKKDEPPLSAPLPKSTSAQEKLSFRDRRKYFEREIKQRSLDESNSNERADKRKKISLVSDQDLRSIKQEEEKKYGTLSKEDIRKSLDIAEEDEEVVDELPNVSSNSPPPQTVFSEGKKYDEKKPQLSARERLNPRYSIPASASSEEDLIRSLEHDVEVVSHVIEGDAVDESPLSERLRISSPDVKREQRTSHHHHDLSPAERRALEAEKRKQWRQARFKSLEADALQAQMMLQPRSRRSTEGITGSSGAQTRAFS